MSVTVGAIGLEIAISRRDDPDGFFLRPLHSYWMAFKHGGEEPSTRLKLMPPLLVHFGDAESDFVHVRDDVFGRAWMRPE